ncbi:DUF2190 family protein [Leptospira santarosai]|uniref:DUF2190 family protein n=1 Tax=Leptospira santarosai TaxID=28183 RepID=UPI0002BEB975|nr:DUF2190 family protein [Leptospira santarosai]EMO12493.1 PF09956 family protein [Leptospira santarosai str. CBC523]MDI7183589.1 DUF2190 family protein [Leptospira santarosai]
MAKIIIAHLPGEDPQTSVVAPTDLLKGQVVKVGNILYVAYVNAKAGNSVTVHVEANKATATKANPAEVIGQFDTIYWSPTGVTKTASGNTKCGIALEPSSANDEDIRILFKGTLGA